MRKKMLWAMLLAPLMALSLVNAIRATPSAEIYITPEVLIDETLTTGSIITLGIGIDYGELIWGYQIELAFNPSILQGVSYDDSGFIGMLGGTTIFAPGAGFDNVNGKLGLFGAALFEKDPALTPSGGGILAIITFEVVGSGSWITDVTAGPDTGVANIYGFWIAHGKPSYALYGNMAPPELYARRRDAVTYEAWQVGYLGDTQTLYSRIKNYAETPVMVKVTFRVRGPAGIGRYVSSEATVPGIADEVPGSAVVSASFIPGPPGKYYYSAVLSFKVVGMTQYLPWELFVGYFGGESASKDINVGFIVKA